MTSFAETSNNVTFTRRVESEVRIYFFSRIICKCFSAEVLFRSSVLGHISLTSKSSHLTASSPNNNIYKYNVAPIKHGHHDLQSWIALYLCSSLVFYFQYKYFTKSSKICWHINLFKTVDSHLEEISNFLLLNPPLRSFCGHLGGTGSSRFFTLHLNCPYLQNHTISPSFSYLRILDSCTP